MLQCSSVFLFLSITLCNKNAYDPHIKRWIDLFILRAIASHVFLRARMGTALCDDSCIWSAIDSAQFADTTKSNHKRRLCFLMQHVYNRRTKTPLLHLVSHPAYPVKPIKAHTDEPQTRKTYASSILACFKHMPQLKEEYPKEFERWLGFERAEGAKIAE